MVDNDEQIALWNGAQGETWVAMQERLDNQLLPPGRATVKALAPRAGARVLDIGGVAGPTTLDPAEQVGPGGSALGVDISEPLLAIARRRAAAAGVDRAQFVAADAQVHAFEPGHDAVYSRFGVMFF